MHPRRWRPVAALTLALTAAPFVAATAVAAQPDASNKPRSIVAVPHATWLSDTTSSVHHVADVLVFAAAAAKAASTPPPPPPPSDILDVKTWIWPGNGPITSPFGSRWGRRHEGVDIDAGYGTPVIARAFMALDAHTYGFTLQELALPFDAVGAPEVAAMLEDVFVPYPNLQAMAELARSGAQLLDFEFGLDLLLDGLERLRPGD